jgi:hypothetical protein
MICHAVNKAPEESANPKALFLRELETFSRDNPY